LQKNIQEKSSKPFFYILCDEDGESAFPKEYGKNEQTLEYLVKTW